MNVNMLTKIFQCVKIAGCSFSKANCHTIRHLVPPKFSPIFVASDLSHQNLLNFNKIAFTPKSISIDLPTNNNSSKYIIDCPLSNKWEIENPLKNIINKEDITLDKVLNLPMAGIDTEKLAAIPGIRVIRKRKMKKHKRKKRRRKTKTHLTTIAKRRAVKRERLFQAELWAQVKEAEKFNAEEYVANKIRILTEDRLPPTFMGEVLSETTMREFIVEQKKMEERKKRKIILTLD